MREVKFIDVDADALQGQMQELGARLVADSNAEAEYYDWPDYGLSQSGITLRLQTRGKIGLTMKINGSGADGHDERRVMEVRLRPADLEKIRTLFHRLGVDQMVEHSAHRITYMLRQVRMHIDMLGEMPPLLIMQAQTQEQLKRTAGELGLPWDERKHWSLAAVKEHYEERRSKGSPAARRQKKKRGMRSED
ncbi:MAG: hypothetical protein G01um101425_947 [Candidatus Peregrinibacteria bacterium Gr01-1014_25]|nr:MAG: hypothetical protein G01um101425_947 [Candidatus Peregrinibacteria bacterium Gr01-1014_25]